MTIPPRLPMSGPFARLYQWLNELRDVVISQQPLNSLKISTQQTRLGTMVKPISDSDKINISNVPRWG